MDTFLLDDDSMINSNFTLRNPTYRTYRKWWPRTSRGFVSREAYLIAGWSHDITFYMEDGLPGLVSSYDHPYLQGILAIWKGILTTRSCGILGDEKNKPLSYKLG